MNLKSLFYCALFFSSYVIASDGGGASGGHHGSPSDLIPPFFNFLVLFSCIGIILKKKLAAGFKHKHNETVQLLERAEIREKEANVKLETYLKKLKNIQQEINEIEHRALQELNDYKAEQLKEINRKIEKLKLDTAYRIESEKNAYIRELNEQIVDSVIEKARKMIDKNREYQQKISQKLLEVIQQ